MSSFFTLPASQRKRKRTGPSNPSSARATKRASTSHSKPERKAPRDESISGSDDDEVSSVGLSSHAESDNQSDYENETAADRRLRLAEQYLENLEREAVDEAGFDAADIDRDYIAERLKEDAAESKGKVHRYVAGELEWETPIVTQFRADQNALTGVAVHDRWIWTVAKDRSIAMWEVPERRIEGTDIANGVRDGQEEGKTDNGHQRRGAKLHPRKKPYLRGLIRPSSRYNKKLKNTYTKTPQPSALGPILSVAVSPSGHLVATGHESHHVAVWTTGIPSNANAECKDSAPSLALHKILSHTHRSPVTSLAFRLTAPRQTSSTTSYSDSNTLYSASADRTLKVWSLDTMAHTGETLYGHQDSVQDVSALRPEICVSVGGRDRTVRYWRVSEEKMLVFRGGGSVAAFPVNKDASSKNGLPEVNGTHDEPPEPSWKRDEHRGKYTEGSIDRIAMLADSYFVSGSDNGSLCLWHTSKKKPLHTIPLAHGRDPPPFAEDDGDDESVDASFSDLGLVPGIIHVSDAPRRDDVPQQPRWITALAALPYSDVVVSGSWDGTVRIWRLSSDKRRLEAAGVLGLSKTAAQTNSDVGEDEGLLKGVINDIKIAAKNDDPRVRDGVQIVVVTSKQHRLGRWTAAGLGEREGGKNQAWIFEVRRKLRETEADDDDVNIDDERD